MRKNIHKPFFNEEFFYCDNQSPSDDEKGILKRLKFISKILFVVNNKNNMNKSLILFCFLFCITAYSQNGDNIRNAIKAPEATTLAKFDAIPVGDYTGSKSFSIPIYEIKTGDVSVPISIRYHASGIMVEDIAGKYGLGWILDIGGINMSYQKYGKEDRKLVIPSMAELANLSASETSMNRTAFQVTGIDYADDSQPDVFGYGTLKNRGSFIIHNKQSVMFPPSKIVLDNNFLNNAFNLASVAMLTPEITDTDGVQYQFANPSVTTPSWDSPSLPGTDSFYTNITWGISKIKTLNNKEINFLYEDNAYDYIANYSETEQIAEIPERDPQDPAVNNPTKYCSGSGIIRKINRVNIKDKVLKQITFPSGKIVFIYNDKNIAPREDSPGNLILKQVKVYDSYNHLIKTVDLNYGYITSSNTPFDITDSTNPLTGAESVALTKRLLLEEVNDSSTGKYAIDYYKNQSIPHRLSNQKDYWGFLSTSGNNSTTFYGKSNAESAKQLSIRSVIYPTGGKHEIDYELNDSYFNGKISRDSLIHIEFGDSDGIPGGISAQKTFPFTINQPGKYKVGFGAAYPPQVPGQVIEGENQSIYVGKLFYNGNLLYTSNSPEEQIELTLDSGNYSFVLQKTPKYSQTPNHTFLFFLEHSYLHYYPYEDNIPHGGIRVKDYKIYDNTVLSKNYTYTYTIPGTNRSSGISYPLFIAPITITESPMLKDIDFTSGTVIFEGTIPDFGTSCIKYLHNNTNSGINLSLIGRSSVGYSYVGEHINSVSDNTSFSVIRKYINHDIDGNDPSPDMSDINYKSMIKDGALPVFLPNENGTLEKEIFKDQYGNTVKENIYNYDFDIHFNNQSGIADLNGTKGVFKGFRFSRKAYLQKAGVEEEQYLQVSFDARPEVYDIGHYFTYNFQMYIIPSNWMKLSSKITKDYINGHVLETKTDYLYSPSYLHLNPVTENTLYSDQSSSKNMYQYALEKNNPLMSAKNMIDIPLESEVVNTTGGISKILSKTETVYPVSQTEANTKTSGFVLPYKVNSTDLLNITTTDVTYDLYDSKGNILQYTTKDGVATSVIWGYNFTQPIAKITGIPYSIAGSLAAAIVTASDNDASNPATEGGLISALDTFRKESALKNAQISTYTYDPLIGVTSITPPSGIREIYKYDSANRLENIKNISGKLLKEFKYNYKH
ncbi:hypothetical protein ACLB9Y_04610 [Chryseobacterium scophthalmum]|uniref:hypothetical protein n=1 Tax=Chryseobacterium scophthalmum TaxID=59733 RepID=UPI00398B3863